VTTQKARAAAVAIDAEQLLVINRRNAGRRYTVLPGGGVEPGEAAGDAVLRELEEETGLVGTAQRHLWTIEHEDRVAHYYAVTVQRQSMALGGPEALTQSEDDRYVPQWVDPSTLDAMNVQPEEIRALLRDMTPQGR
jgi:8-oxo-dGTP diphosphatase